MPDLEERVAVLTTQLYEVAKYATANQLVLWAALSELFAERMRDSPDPDAAVKSLADQLHRRIDEWRPTGNNPVELEKVAEEARRRIEELLAAVRRGL